MNTMLEQAVAEIKAGNIEKARPLLIEFLKQNPQSEDAWLWMTRCVTDTEQKKYCFEKVLKINPQNQHAIRGLERLNNPVPPITQPKIKPVAQQPVHQSLPKKSNSTVVILAGLGLLGFLCICGAVLLWNSPVSNSPNNSIQQNTPAPAHTARPERPNYRQILETNGLIYGMDDAEGDPIYVSPCGLVVVVKPDYMGFAAKYNPDNLCAVEDLGAIITIIYPSEVIDFVVANMNSVIVEDETVHGRAAGYNVNIDFDPYDPKLIVTIEEPH